MYDITDLSAWERLFKKIVWKQLGDMEGKKMVKVQRLFAKTNLKQEKTQKTLVISQDMCLERIDLRQIEIFENYISSAWSLIALSVRIFKLVVAIQNKGIEGEIFFSYHMDGCIMRENIVERGELYEPYRKYIQI